MGYVTREIRGSTGEVDDSVGERIVGLVGCRGLVGRGSVPIPHYQWLVSFEDFPPC